MHHIDGDLMFRPIFLRTEQFVSPALIQINIARARGCSSHGMSANNLADS